MASVCRDCLAHSETVRPTGRRCPNCGSPRLLTHPELFTLSIAHLDCDAFYAAVEKRDDPSLVDKPVIVGGGQRGVVSTACYIARTYGIRSAMPMFKALRACPEAVVIKPDMGKYAAVSRAVRERMDQLTPQVEPLSLDEAFMDLAGTAALHKAPPAVVLVRLAHRIEAEIGITASIGLSHNKFLAKIASDLDKPRGFSVIGRAETEDFLADKPVGIIWGVGQAMRRKLERDGLRTVADLRRVDEAWLIARYGAMGRRLSALAWGRDARIIETGSGAKSISTERTFHEDIADFAALDRILWGIAETLSARCKARETAGRQLTLKLKTADFRSLTRNATVDRPLYLAQEIYDAARPLLAAETRGRVAYRLLGIGLQQLCPIGEAERTDLLSMLDTKHESLRRTEAALDALRAKFGDGAVFRGRSLKR